MKHICLVITFFLFAVVSINAQECPHPSGCVTVSRDVALKALADSDTVKAQANELAVKDTAIEDMRKELNRMRIEFAEKSGELTALRQNAVSDRAIIDILLKNVRPKKIGLINF